MCKRVGNTWIVEVGSRRVGIGKRGLYFLLFTYVHPLPSSEPLYFSASYFCTCHLLDATRGAQLLLPTPVLQCFLLLYHQ